MSRWEIGLGIILPIALVASGYVAGEWLGGPPAETSVARVTTAAAAPGLAGLPDFGRGAAAEEGLVPLPCEGEPPPVDISPIVNVNIRIVCCRRGEDDALWTTAGMCEQMGTIADERLCPTTAPPAAVPAPKPILASASSTPAPPSPEQMAIVRAHLAESVCCESNGRTSRMSRSECNASIDNSEVDGRRCEPVCCYRGAAQTTEWDSRGNCGGPSDSTSVVVSEDKCEEICCQMPDQTLHRDGRRTCVNRGGSPRALFHCGTSVTAMKQLPVTDPERIHAGESRQENVDVDVAEKSKGRAMGVWMNEIGPGREARLPPASPFF